MSHCMNLWYGHREPVSSMPLICVISRKRNLMRRGNSPATAAQGPAELTTKWKSSSCEWEVTVIFSPLRGPTSVDAAGLTQWRWLQHIYHRVPFNSGLPSGVSQSPWVEFLHLQSFFSHSPQIHHTSPPECPRHSRYSYKTLFSYPSCHRHFTLTRSTRIGLKLVMNNWLSLQNLESWDVSQT